MSASVIYQSGQVLPRHKWCRLTWVEVEYDVDDVLVSPGDGKAVVLVDGHHVLLPTELA